MEMGQSSIIQVPPFEGSREAFIKHYESKTDTSVPQARDPERTITRSLMEKGFDLGNRVCRIISAKDQSGLATGFMIAPGIVMTNNHVIKEISACDKVCAQFFSGRKEAVSISFTKDLFITSLCPDSGKALKDKLDYTIVSVSELYKQYPDILKTNLTLPFNKSSLELGKQANVVGHPEGCEDQIYAYRKNEIEENTPPSFCYTTETKGGSSGSPVFNCDWDLIGLHRAGRENAPYRQEGVSIVSIIDDLQANGGKETLEAYLTSINQTGVLNTWWG